MIKNNLKNFLDDIKISNEAKEFWMRICGKLSPEEIEAFIILKKQNSEDLIKAIDILMRREKALLDKNPQALKEIFEEGKNMLEN